MILGFLFNCDRHWILDEIYKGGCRQSRFMDMLETKVKLAEIYVWLAWEAVIGEMCPLYQLEIKFLNHAFIRRE